MAGYLQPRKRTGDHCGFTRYDLALTVTDEHWSWVSGAGVREQPAAGFVHRTKNRHEHVHGVLSRKCVVDLLENLCRFLELPPQSADERHCDSHEERRGDALPGDVADHHDQ